MFMFILYFKYFLIEKNNMKFGAITAHKFYNLFSVQPAYGQHFEKDISDSIHLLIIYSRKVFAYE